MNFDHVKCSIFDNINVDSQEGPPLKVILRIYFKTSCLTVQGLGLKWFSSELFPAIKNKFNSLIETFQLSSETSTVTISQTLPSTSVIERKNSSPVSMRVQPSLIPVSVSPSKYYKSPVKIQQNSSGKSSQHVPTQIANLESKLTETLQTLDKVNFENFLSSTETKYGELLKRMSKLETEIKKINNKNLEKSINSVDEGNLIEKIQKIVKDSLNSFVVDKDLLDSKDKQINLLMEEHEEKTNEIQKLKKNKAEKDEVNRLKQALSSKEQELNACKTQLSKKDNFEQELNDMVTVLREKQNENARIHAELYNMQNELLRLRSVENELTSKSKELESCKKECDQLAITLSEKNDIIHDLLIKSKESIIPASSQTNTPDKVVNNDLESMYQTDLNETPKRVVLLGDSLLKQVIP